MLWDGFAATDVISSLDWNNIGRTEPSEDHRSRTLFKITGIKISFCILGRIKNKHTRPSYALNSLTSRKSKEMLNGSENQKLLQVCCGKFLPKQVNYFEKYIEKVCLPLDIFLKCHLHNKMAVPDDLKCFINKHLFYIVTKRSQLFLGYTLFCVYLEPKSEEQIKISYSYLHNAV